MAFNLTNIVVEEVTLCKNPVVGDNAKFKLLKSENEKNSLFQKTITFQKSDTEKQQVFGYVLVPDVEDSQGDICSKESIEKACHSFMKSITHSEQKGDTGTGLEHTVFEGIGYPIESYIDSEGVHGVEGGWWLGTQVTNDVIWKAIKEGEITGYSMGGTGIREPVTDVTEPVETQKAVPEDAILENPSFMTKLVKAVKKALTFDETVKQDSKWLMVDSFYHWQDVLTDTIWDIAYSDNTDKKTLIANAFDDCKNAVLNSIDAMGETTFIAKSIEEKENNNLTLEELNKALETSIQPLVEEVQGIKKGLEDVQKKQEDTLNKACGGGEKEEKADDEENVCKSEAEKSAITAEDISKAVTTCLEPIQKAVTELGDRLEVVEKSTQGSTAILGQTEVEKSKDDLEWGNLFSF